MLRLATILATVATAVFATGAGATTSDISSNWSGYSVSGATFSSVSGSWVEPKASCSGSTTSSAFWVGLGGETQTSNALEQIGTSADCTREGTASYSAWYELVPAASVPIKLAVAPGNKLWASVQANGTAVTLTVKNLTRKTSFTRTLAMASPDVSSAEWIAEAPSTCDDYGNCQTVTLTNFGKVAFSNAHATANGHTGTISDPAWTADSIQLQGSDASFGPFASYDGGNAEANPTVLSAGGSSFSVGYSLAAQPAETDPYGGVGVGPEVGIPGLGFSGF